MIIAVCGSLTFYKEIRDIQHKLEALGHTALIPKSIRMIEEEGYKKPQTVKERLKAEAAHHFISEHFKKVEQADSILVVNLDNHGISGYIGGNTFLEIGIAFYLGKKIYFLNPIPHMGYELELASMYPVVLHGDLSKI
jgi:nucleoside 2-deoxyribosyltransferase